jgi:predicted transglutaminase-like cysteine proteinase
MRHWLCAFMLGLLSPVAAHATLPIALFKTAEIRTESHDGLKQWQRVLDRIRKEQPIYAACSTDLAACPNRATKEWLGFLHQLEGRPLEDQVVRVNRFVNRWQYRSDPTVYGKSDYWASPLQFVANSGDCEDYAITKYISLRLLGIPDERLRVAVVHDRVRDLAHAVLVVYQDDTAVVLDNLTNAVLPHDVVANYTPYYTINATTRWAHVPSSRIDMAAVGGSGADGQ